MEVFHGEAVLVAPRRQVDGVRLDICEIEQWNRGDEPAEREAGPVLGLGNVASFSERPVAVAATFDQEDQGGGGRLVFEATITEYRDETGELVITARGVSVRPEAPVDGGVDR